MTGSFLSRANKADICRPLSLLLVLFLAQTLYAQPRIISATPDRAEPRQTIVVRIVGADTDFHYVQGSNLMGALLVRGQRSISANRIVINSAIELDATFSIPSNAELGAYDVGVTSPWQNNLPLVGGFFVRHQTLRYVPDGYATINSALDNATPGDTIILRNGSYGGPLEFDGIDVVIGSEFILGGDSTCIDSTIIDGHDSGTVLTFDDNVPGNIRIVGVTITGGRANFGGGISIDGAISPHFQHCRITGNHAVANGGGVYLTGPSAVSFESCIFSANTCGANGSALCTRFDGRPVLRNSLVIGNGSGRSGTIYAADESQVFLLNSTLAYNPSSGTGGVHLRSGKAVIVNSILWGNRNEEVLLDVSPAASELTVAFSDIDGGQERIVNPDSAEIDWLEGNLNADPLFYDHANNNFQLAIDSPARDAGTAQFILENDTLINIEEGGWLGDGVDMGPYEREPVWVRGEEEGEMPGGFELVSAFPNPFNSTTQINYVLPSVGNISLQVLDLQGRVVADLISGKMTAGRHSAIWQAGNSPAGIYFSKLKFEGDSKVIQLLLIK